MSVQEESGLAIEQAITQEETLELSIQLHKNCNDPAQALKILKLLDRKAITAQHLIDTKIGKSLTAVQDQPDADRPTADNPELLEQVTKMKEHLKRKWKQIHSEYKSKKQQSRSGVAGKPESAASAGAQENTRPGGANSVNQEQQQKQLEESSGNAARRRLSSTNEQNALTSSTVTLPYIPGGYQSYTTGDESRDVMIKKFITKLQTPITNENNLQYEKSVLIGAIQIAKDVEQEIFDINRGIEKMRKDKFRQMMSVFQQHPHMRTRLLNGRVSAHDFVRMKRDDFLSAELKRQKSEAEDRQIQATRIDFARAQDMKVGFKDSFFTCRKCKSKKTSYYQQQTRGADEPMTNFISCMECLYEWKE